MTPDYAYVIIGFLVGMLLGMGLWRVFGHPCAACGWAFTGRK